MNKTDIKTILAVGAHHDDNELIAGTLAAHKKMGWRVISVIMTDSSVIGNFSSGDHIEIRRKESRNAAKLLGMETHFLGFADGHLIPSQETKMSLVELFRQFCPAIVITHPPKDYHPDHSAASMATSEAVMLCNNPALATQASPCPMPKLYYNDGWFVPFLPDVYVDITEFIDLKLSMLRCHESQLNTEESEDDMVNLAKLQSRRRGVEAGVKYAEAFCLVPNLGSVRLKKQLGE